MKIIKEENYDSVLFMFYWPLCRINNNIRKKCFLLYCYTSSIDIIVINIYHKFISVHWIFLELYKCIITDIVNYYMRYFYMTKLSDEWRKCIDYKGVD